MKKSWLRFLAVFFLMLLPLCLTICVGFLTPTVFEKTFLGELDNKVSRLDGTQTPKIVVIGGSSAAFSVDAKGMEEMLGMPVINFGLYATLGTKAMLDFSRKGINKGDIIVIAPEMNDQTWSLYFNAESMWQAADGNFSLLFRVGKDNRASMLGGYWRFAASKLRYLRDGAPDPAGIYNVASFDEYGFVRYRRDRDYNIMAGGMDSSMPISFASSMISNEFIDYVNDYIDFAKGKGATVYLGFCPMNEAALSPDTTLKSLEEFTAFLRHQFRCEVLGDPNEYIYESGYFFDSNFHTNSAGAVMHSVRLATDLAAAMGRELTQVPEIPEAPEIPEEPEGPYPYDENEVYFKFEETEHGVKLIGVTDLGKEQTVLTTPVAYNGKKVVLFGDGVFADCGKLTELTITENLTQLQDGMFVGASSLMKIHIFAADPNNCRANNMSERTAEGLSDGAKFYVPAASYSDYVINYFWGPYASLIAAEP